jgi:hypothetical protein
MAYGFGAILLSLSFLTTIALVRRGVLKNSPA